jgi:hypothetical protein
VHGSGSSPPSRHHWSTASKIGVAEDGRGGADADDMAPTVAALTRRVPVPLRRLTWSGRQVRPVRGEGAVRAGEDAVAVVVLRPTCVQSE